MRQLINDGWSFVKLPAGSTPADAERAGYSPVDIPHDWLIWQENLYETADAWYRRTIELPDDHEPVVFLCFDGVYMDCDVLLNGEVIFNHPYGYTAFDVPLTGLLKPGENLIQVHIRHQSPNSRWYSGSGIYRDVHLITFPTDYLIPDSLYLKEEPTDQGWRLELSAETEGSEKQTFSCSVISPDGRTVAQSEGIQTGNHIRAALQIPDGRAWSPDDPYLYTLDIKYGDQSLSRKIGLRSVLLSSNHGLTINGRPMKLKGVCLHHDLGALGSAFHEKAARRQLQLMKDMGANAVRTSHNPPADKFLDLCDEMGLLVVDEAFDMWERKKTTYDYARFFPGCYRNDVASWIRRDRCHPSVIMWSIGNEIYDMHADLRGTEVTRLLAQEVRIHDPKQHAYVTFGCNYMPWEGGQRCAEYVDAVGYNYGEKYYAQHHAKHPSWVIYGSETASVLSSRGIYHFPIEQSIMSDADAQCSALGNSNTSWGAENLGKIIIDDLLNPYSMGQFIWSGIDYIGEPTPYHTRSCYFGQADTACYPKDSYYLFKSYWKNESMIHIGVIWDWNPGQMIDVPVITNCAETELFLNGVSQGRKKSSRFNPDQYLPVWKLPFSPGILKAIGYDDHGNILCEDYHETPDESDHLVLTCENDSLSADGWDLAFVTVQAEDREGRVVENARDRVRISVTGGGRLLGTDNGDSTDPDSYKSDCRRLFSGKLLLIIGSNGIRQDAYVHVQGKHVGRTVLRIPVRDAAKRSGVSCIQQAEHHIVEAPEEARRLEIRALSSTSLTPDHETCEFSYTIHPAHTSGQQVLWQVTNTAGIETPFVCLYAGTDRLTVRAIGDGEFCLRGLCQVNGQCLFISQMEFTASGFGNPSLDPYTYLSAGLYDLHEGDIGTGNEKGIAFSRDGESMAGFSRVDFGKTGSDTITIDVFALDSKPYEIELWAGSPGSKLCMIDILHYEKPSIWNVYQPETWKLPVRLKGLQTVCFRMREKVHMKGFFFEKQHNAWLKHSAGSAETIYGDCFERCGDAVNHIGNNVTLTWTGLDFSGASKVILLIDGSTKLPVNTVSVRIRNGEGEETVTAADFDGNGEKEQRFSVRVPEGECSVSFVFLPGSSFDFRSFRFCKAENLDIKSIIR